jgi:septum formation protein
MKKVILASQSPRRKELLSAMGVDFDVVPSDFDEKLDDARSPEVVAAELALGKAMAVAEQFPDSIVIGSDTIVTVGGKQLGKPQDVAEAHAMLESLSGTSNLVTTGVAIVRKSDRMQLVGTDTTEVYFKPYDQAAVEAYVRTGDPYDKAGGYGIQSGAAPLIERMVGHYDTVVGLPTRLTAVFLEKVDVPAQSVELEPPVEQTLSK